MSTVDVTEPLAHAAPAQLSFVEKTSPGLAFAQAAVRIRADLPLMALDASIVCACYFAALVLRFDGAVPPLYWDRFRALVLAAVLAHGCANWGFGLYRHMWRHASVAEARSVIGAALTATAAIGATSVVTLREPLSVVVVGGAATMMFTGALRFHSRLFAFKRGNDATAGLRVAVVGAGSSGAMIVREMRRNSAAGLVPVAVLDDDVQTHRMSLAGVPVVGAIERLPDVVQQFGIHQVVVAIPSAGPELVERVAHLAELARVAVKVTPPVNEILGGEVSVRDVRDLRIEDLLGRAQVVTDLDAVRGLLCGRRVLITGAGGSIGSEVARQVALCDPASLVLLDHDETHLFEAAATLSVDASEVLADIRDAAVLRRVLLQHRPQVVFHAAAHKHVPVLERHPREAVSTNVTGTVNLLNAARESGVERLVFISTDKAVNPASVMGATKWLGERLVIEASGRGARHCAVRFGNVAGSRGSVIPTFARQIAAGGPVTVTDPDMTRYFMSVHEAVQLVLQAAALAEGGEVFMLDMGEPVNILALAERMIRLSGRNVGADIPVVVIGPRPGEKLAESLRSPLEEVGRTGHDAILRVRPQTPSRAVMNRGVRRLLELAATGDDADVARQLFDLANGSPLEPHGRGPAAVRAAC